MGIFQICALALGGAFIVLLLRLYHPSFALAVSLLLSVILLLQTFSLLRLLQNEFFELFSWAVNEYYGVLLKAIGIGLVVQATAELCREAGQPALEGKIILLGKLLIVAAVLPLFGRVMTLLTEMLL